ncbi:AMP-binding protein [Acrocarpospora sp. B8E8]|uniref:AMP-binding protein n=1 Tax=Acrocarpospora sp. B8E8 TaxID=3153572 RepID=UPI00325CE77C
MTVTLPGLLRARAREQPSRTALICDDTAKLSFGEWDEQADATAFELLERGLLPGDRVGLRYDNARWADYAIAFLGVLRAGGVAVPLPSRQSDATLHLMLEDCQARWILNQPIHPSPARTSTATTDESVIPQGIASSGIARNPEIDSHATRRETRRDPALQPGITWIETGQDFGATQGETHAATQLGLAWTGIGQHPEPGNEPRGSRWEPVVGSGDLAQILYTSGTTGQPKGVAASHANLAFGHRPHPGYRMLSHSEHFLHAFPIGTNAGQMMLVNTLVAHPAALVASVFEAERFCALIAEHRVGTVFLVPSMAVDLLNSGAWRRHDLSSVLLLSSSADALPPHVAVALPEAFPKATIVNFYTSTEAVPAQTTMIVDPARPHSVGRATESGDLRITGDDGAAAEIGEVGEVWLRAPAAQRSYYGDPQASERVFQRGWTRMGDLGYLDRDGYLYLVGRESDVIKSGGLKISTLQVEAALQEHPAVAEVAVLGVPHPVMGAMVAAAVVSRSPATADELRTFLHQRLARNEIPTRYAFVDALPRNELGKVVKGELRELFTAPRNAKGRPLETPEQQALARLWSGVLGLPVTSPDDDFFALGGDSLKATQLATRATEEFGVDVPGTLAFDHPTLSAQAEHVTLHAPTQNLIYPEISTELGALSGVQEHWWRWMHAAAETRHMPPVHVAVQIDGQVDAGLVDRCLAELVRRHEALRTVFRDGRAFIEPESHVRVTVHEACDEAEAGHLAADLVRAPFDIGRGPLLRAALIRLRRGRTGCAGEPAAGGGLYRDCGPTGGAGSTNSTSTANSTTRAQSTGSPKSTTGAQSSGSPEATMGTQSTGSPKSTTGTQSGGSPEATMGTQSSGGPEATGHFGGSLESTVLVIAAHHMIFDGWSAGVLLRELGVLYSAFSHNATSPLPPPTQYADFVAFEHREWHRSRPHWRTTLNGAPSTLPALPGRSPTVTLCAAISHDFPIAPVRDLASRHNATSAMVLAAAWATTLSTWANSPEIVLATPVTGRSHPEFEATIGCLFRWNLLRIPIDSTRDENTNHGDTRAPDAQGGGIVARVRRAILTANDHQFHNFARLHELVPYPAYFRFESWGRPAHLPGLPSQEFPIPAGPIMEWRLADDDPDTHPPELLITEHPDGSLTGSMIYNKYAYQTADMAALADAFTATIPRLA